MNVRNSKERNFGFGRSARTRPHVLSHIFTLFLSLQIRDKVLIARMGDRFIRAFPICDLHSGLMGDVSVIGVVIASERPRLISKQSIANISAMSLNPCATHSTLFLFLQ